ncbi:MAG: 4Fe-4S dicluster domain-containing protein, partial [Candidatus Firestonebacteria bacterium]
AEAKEEFKKAAEIIITRRINLALIKTKLDSGFDSPYWDEAHIACVKCGACTYVCPTCYCFDITEKRFDYLNGERIRTWDTCMSEMFTKMSGGHNPRTDTKRRFRQRFMHKFSYHVDNFNEELCTGCGRCIIYCPVGIDIRKVIEEAE